MEYDTGYRGCMTKKEERGRAREGGKEEGSSEKQE
jgi:hypothetical protein